MNRSEITYFEYARKSTEGEDRQALSIPAQLKENRQLIERLGLSVSDTFTDKASAAVPYNRPGYAEMIHRIKKGEAAGIVVWHVDRLIRNSLEEGEFKWLLTTGVIKSIWTPGREYRSEDNVLLFSIEASMAEQYSRDLSVKVRRGMRQKYAQGQPASKAPLGYSNTRFQAHGTNYITKDPERFDALRKGFDLMLTGAYTVEEIARILSDEYGLRGYRGKRVSKATMYRVFRSPFYYGRFVRKGVNYDGSYPAMITPQEFDQVQALLRRTSNHRYQKHEAAYSGFIRCTCGSAITMTQKVKRIKSTGEVKQYVFYYCSKRKKGSENCPHRTYLTETELERIIVSELRHYAIHSEFKDWAVECFQDMSADEVERRNRLIATIAQEEQRLNRELENLLDLRVSDMINDEKYKEKRIEKEEQLLRLRAEQTQVSASLNTWPKLVEQALEFCVATVERFLNGDEKTKKVICGKFGRNWVLDGKKLLVERKKWLEPIKNMKEICEYHLHRFEPGKNLMKSDYNVLFGHLSFNMRRLRNEVVTLTELFPEEGGKKSPNKKKRAHY